MVSIEGNFAKKFNDLVKFNICKLVKDTESLISGSCCLSMLFPERVDASDVDVYTAAHYLPRMTAALIQLGYKIHTMNSTSDYNKSGFFRKNKIYSRLVFTKKNSLDIDVVCTTIAPLTVVTNFDLTVCQVWFDGEKLSASHEETLRMKGYLNPSYLNLLGKACLTKRLIKYTRRGFTTSFPGLVNDEEEFKEELAEDRTFEELLSFFIARETFRPSEEGFAIPLAEASMTALVPLLGINCNNIRLKRRELLSLCIEDYFRRNYPAKNRRIQIRKCINLITSNCDNPNCLSRAYHAPQDEREVSEEQKILEREVKLLRDPDQRASLVEEYNK